MHVPLSPEVWAVIGKAYETGVETSLGELAYLFDCEEGGILVAAAAVLERVRTMDLELLPGIEKGGFTDVRVLRKIESPEADDVGAMIDGGETATVEFKSSLLCSMHHWRDGQGLMELPGLPGEVLKTICAFLNSGGGELFVGVDDDGTLSDGILRDLELKGWTLDRWQLHLSNLVAGQFFDGAMVLPYLRPRMLSVEGSPVFHVSVMPRRARSFVRKEKSKPFEFFLRNGPQTNSLDLPGFYAYITARE